VWNRTAGRANDLVQRGAQLAPDALSAVKASPVSIFVVLDYDAVSEILCDEVLAMLRERTVVVMTFGLKAEVNEAAARVLDAGGSFLAGGILAYPRALGRPETTIFYSGSPRAFETYESVLRHLAPAQRFVGPNPTLAQTVLSAAGGIGFAATVAYFEMAAWAETSGVSPAVLAELARSATLPWIGDCLADAGRRIGTGSFEGDQATVDVHASALAMALMDMQEARVESKTLRALQDYVQIAQRKGLGSGDISALFCVVRETDSTN
jgi:3-hydroxyisobutyrate dehydrogenase-like beta-hydroxyacid dehydrogenase